MADKGCMKMRYIGNKESIIDEIQKLIESKKLIGENKVFFDAFSGTATVGNYFKNQFKIIANDYLHFSFVYSNGRLNNVRNGFKKLNLDPFSYFNEFSSGRHDFITENYSPAGKSGRMYFSTENAMKIDYIRYSIEEWKKAQLITDREYYYLIACLLESVSKVANIAGVYGAYLKIWDPRAVKPMKFIEIDSKDDSVHLNEIYNKKLEDIISDVECDILYLDPPYPKNQYSVQYHILETISKYDSPEIKGITGGRVNKGTTSEWSMPGKVEILFDKVIAKTSAKHVILSYSSDGIMSKEFIESVLKRYGKENTIEFRKFVYKKYRNHQTTSENEHYEYLFYIELKDKNDINYSSPLNYMGGKYDMIHFLKENEPQHYTKFIDLFGGGFNVGVNSRCLNVIYNDCNFKVKQLIEMFRDVETSEIYKFLIQNIKKYGLTKNGKDAYIKARKDYNHPEPPLRDPKLLYLLVLYGFQQQIRFNSSLEYNNPVGESSFNDRIHEKLVSFSRVLKEKKTSFYSDDFTELLQHVDSNTFVYSDPPYLITLGSYNDGKRGFNGWGEEDENRLHEFLDNITVRGGKFMLSNVLTHKGKTNQILLNWISRNNYRLIKYDDKIKKAREEVIIVNY